MNGTRSPIRRTRARVPLDFTRGSIQASTPSPARTTSSAPATARTSPGFGSKACGFAPLGTSWITSASGAATSRTTDAYGAKVTTTEGLAAAAWATPSSRAVRARKRMRPP